MPLNEIELVKCVKNAHHSRKETRKTFIPSNTTCTANQVPGLIVSSYLPDSQCMEKLPTTCDHANNTISNKMANLDKTNNSLNKDNKLIYRLPTPSDILRSKNIYLPKVKKIERPAIKNRQIVNRNLSGLNTKFNISPRSSSSSTSKILSDKGIKNISKKSNIELSKNIYETVKKGVKSKYLNSNCVKVESKLDKATICKQKDPDDIADDSGINSPDCDQSHDNNSTGEIETYLTDGKCYLEKESPLANPNNSSSICNTSESSEVDSNNTCSIEFYLTPEPSTCSENVKEMKINDKISIEEDYKQEAIVKSNFAAVINENKIFNSYENEVKNKITNDRSECPNESNELQLVEKIEKCINDNKEINQLINQNFDELILKSSKNNFLYNTKSTELIKEPIKANIKINHEDEFKNDMKITSNKNFTNLWAENQSGNPSEKQIINNKVENIFPYDEHFLIYKIILKSEINQLKKNKIIKPSQSKKGQLVYDSLDIKVTVSNKNLLKNYINQFAYNKIDGKMPQLFGCIDVYKNCKNGITKQPDFHLIIDNFINSWQSDGNLFYTCGNTLPIDILNVDNGKFSFPIKHFYQYNFNMCKKLLEINSEIDYLFGIHDLLDKPNMFILSLLFGKLEISLFGINRFKLAQMIIGENHLTKTIKKSTSLIPVRKTNVLIPLQRPTFLNNLNNHRCTYSQTDIIEDCDIISTNFDYKKLYYTKNNLTTWANIAENGNSCGINYKIVDAFDEDSLQVNTTLEISDSDERSSLLTDERSSWSDIAISDQEGDYNHDGSEYFASCSNSESDTKQNFNFQYKLFRNYPNKDNFTVHKKRIEYYETIEYKKDSKDYQTIKTSFLKLPLVKTCKEYTRNNKAKYQRNWKSVIHDIWKDQEIISEKFVKKPNRTNTPRAIVKLPPLSNKTVPRKLNIKRVFPQVVRHVIATVLPKKLTLHDLDKYDPFASAEQQMMELFSTDYNQPASSSNGKNSDIKNKIEIEKSSLPIQITPDITKSNTPTKSPTPISAFAIYPRKFDSLENLTQINKEGNNNGDDNDNRDCISSPLPMIDKPLSLLEKQLEEIDKEILLNNLESCSVVSIDSVIDNNINTCLDEKYFNTNGDNTIQRQKNPTDNNNKINSAGSGRFTNKKVNMQQMLFGTSPSASRNNQSQSDTPTDINTDSIGLWEEREAEILLELEKMFNTSPKTIPPSSSSSASYPLASQPSFPICSSDETPDTTSDIKESGGDKKNTCPTIDSAYSSLTRVLCEGDTTRAEQSRFCHECGTQYPVAIAKFCCYCGMRRIAI